VAWRLEHWSEDDIATSSNRRNAHTAAFSIMAEVIKIDPVI
jgi:hypothetical protein